MSSRSITGNPILFRKGTAGGDVILKNAYTGYELKFGSDIIFEMDASFKTVTLGKFQFALSDDKDKLVIKKDGQTGIVLE